MATLREKDQKAAKNWKLGHRKQRKVKKTKAQLRDSYKQTRQRKTVISAELCVKGQINNPTPEEKIIQEILEYHGISYQFQKAIVKGSVYYVVDFLIETKSKALIIEADGYYHFTEEGKKRDIKRSKWIKSQMDCEFLRFPNFMINKKTNEVSDAIILKLASLQS